MFFKWNRMQRDIDSFKMMQEGLNPAARMAREAQRAAVAMPSAVSQGAPTVNGETIDSVVNRLNGGSRDLQHTFVSGEATWEGKLRTEASARIEGSISGEIDAGETVFIAKGAHVRANVHARRVIVAGALEGQITCREQLVVEHSGRIEGKVSTETLIIEEGAVVQSEIRMRYGDEPTQAISKDPIAWDNTVTYWSDKMNSRRAKSGQAGSSEPKPNEPQAERKEA